MQEWEHKFNLIRLKNNRMNLSIFRYSIGKPLRRSISPQFIDFLNKFISEFYGNEIMMMTKEKGWNFHDKGAKSSSERMLMEL